MYFRNMYISRLIKNNSYKSFNKNVYRSYKDLTKMFYDPYFKHSVRGPRPMTKSGGWTTVTIMPGVEPGPGLMQHALKILDCAGSRLDFEIVYPEKSEDEYQMALQSVKRNGVAIKSEIESRDIKLLYNEPTRNMRLRRDLEQFANVVEFKSFPGLEKKKKFYQKSLDIVLMRAITEGEYALIEHEPVRNMIENVRVRTYARSRNLCDYAFKFAKQRQRSKVTFLVNQEVTPVTDDMLQVAFDETAAEHSEVKSETQGLSDAIQKFLAGKSNWDVIITSSIAGSMLIYMILGILGSSYLVAQGNIGDRYKVFGAVDKLKGQVSDKLNPTGYIMAGVQLLQHIGLYKQAADILQSIKEVHFEDKISTPDVGGKATTEEFTLAIMRRLKSKRRLIFCKNIDKLPVLPPKPTGVKPYVPDLDTRYNLHKK